MFSGLHFNKNPKNPGNAWYVCPIPRITLNFFAAEDCLSGHVKLCTDLWNRLLGTEQVEGGLGLVHVAHEPQVVEH